MAETIVSCEVVVVCNVCVYPYSIKNIIDYAILLQVQLGEFFPYSAFSQNFFGFCESWSGLKTKLAC